MNYKEISKETLQAATVISKTAETLIGKQIECGGYEFLTLFFKYTKGDETGLNIYPYYLFENSGDEYQDQSWASAAGTKTLTENIYQVTASGNYMLTLDVRGISKVKFYQGGSNNDGTPTGTLAASYILK